MPHKIISKVAGQQSQRHIPAGQLQGLPATFIF